MINSIKITLVLIFISTFSFSQVNENIDFINNANINIRNIQLKIKELDDRIKHNELQNKKDGDFNKVYYKIDNFDIVIFPKKYEEYFNKIKPSQFNHFTDKMKKQLDLLYAKNTELKLYFDLNEHKADNYKKYINFKKEILKIVKNYRQTYLEFISEIRKNKKFEKHKAYNFENLFYNFLMNEVDKANKLTFNYTPNLSEGNCAFLLRNGKETFLKVNELEFFVKNNKLLYDDVVNPEYLSSTWRKIINSRRLEIGKDAYDEVLLLHLNRLTKLIKGYNDLCSYYKRDKNFNLSKVPTPLHFFTKKQIGFKNSKINPRVTPIGNTEIKYFSTGKKWTKKERRAFLSYTKFLEEAAANNSSLYTRMASILDRPRIIEHYITDGFIHRHAMGYIPEAEFLMLEKLNKNLPEEYQKPFLEQAKQIKNALIKLHLILEELNLPDEYVNSYSIGTNEEYFNKIDKINKEYIPISDSLISQCIKLDLDIHKAYNKRYEPQKYIKSLPILKDILDEEQQIITSLTNSWKHFEKVKPINNDRFKELYTKLFKYEMIEEHLKNVFKNKIQELDFKTKYIYLETSSISFFKQLNEKIGILSSTSPDRYQWKLRELNESLKHEYKLSRRKYNKLIEYTESFLLPEMPYPSPVRFNKKNYDKQLKILEDSINKSQSLDELPTLNFVFLIDVSGSMKDENKLPLLKKSIEIFIEKMRYNDKVSIVTYSEKATQILSPTTILEKEKILQKVNKLTAKGNTETTKGLKLAYKLINQSYSNKISNKIILMSDGDFPVNEKITKLIETNAKRKTQLSFFYLSEKKDANYNKWEKLTKLGKGRISQITPQNYKFSIIYEAKNILK